MRRAALGGACLLAIVAGGSRAATRAPACPATQLSAGYTRSVNQALLAGRDVWGEAVLRAPGGPSYAAVRRYLKPLLLVGHLTDSGVYYLAFGRPGGPFALHVADGSEILWRRADGARLRVDVGSERYGSCLSRLELPRLANGWLPILETSYLDAGGRRYRQESFATTPPDAPASFVRLTVPAHGRARLGALEVRGPRTVYAAFDGRSRPLDAQTYARGRADATSYWKAKLNAGAGITVPDARVDDAERNLLIQNLLLGWRYSIGNAYETFEFPESLANASVLGEYGFGREDRAIVEASFHREPHLYPNWEAGERLLEAARYERLYQDGSFLTAALPYLRRYVNQLAARIGAHSLLPSERYASDLPQSAYSLNGQAVDLQGLQAIAPYLPESRAARDRLITGLGTALRSSERRLTDGSLFVPVRLKGDERPYERITASRAGSYWNLVIPDALASGVIAPGSREAAGVLAYLLRHGSRLLGLLRFNYYPAPVGSVRAGGLPGYRTSGSDDVYNLGLERFLADNHQADLLALTLYGKLAAGMTENTYVSGEGATIGPVPGETYRELYLPPNSTANAAFLECLRLMLIHETPDGLELAYGTPRRWLVAGKRIAVRDAPTSFGPVSFNIAASQSTVAVSLTPPNRAQPHSLTLRLRLPGGERIARVTVNGRAFARVNRRAGTIDLTGEHGQIELTVQVGHPARS